MDSEKRAPGWQVRCRKCGVTEPWGKYGIRRGAVGTAYTIGWCAKCRWLRIHVIEKVRPVSHLSGPAPAGPAEPM